VQITLQLCIYVRHLLVVYLAYDSSPFSVQSEDFKIIEYINSECELIDKMV
jgi:hypothetical protein